MSEVRLNFPCPERCTHRLECAEATRRRAQGGHVCVIVVSPKMDAPDLVAAVCSCNEYRSGPTTESKARASWRTHADQKMDWNPPLAITRRLGLAPGDLARLPRNPSPPSC